MYRLLKELLNDSRNSARKLNLIAQKICMIQAYVYIIMAEAKEKSHVFSRCICMTVGHLNQLPINICKPGLSEDNFDHKCPSSSKSFCPGLREISKHLTEFKRILQTLPYTGNFRTMTLLVKNVL